MTDHDELVDKFRATMGMKPKERALGGAEWDAYCEAFHDKRIATTREARTLFNEERYSELTDEHKSSIREAINNYLRQS